MTDPLPTEAGSHRLLNFVQTLLLIGGMMLLLGLTARLLFGDVTPRHSPRPI